MTQFVHHMLTSISIHSLISLCCEYCDVLVIDKFVWQREISLNHFCTHFDYARWSVDGSSEDRLCYARGTGGSTTYRTYPGGEQIAPLAEHRQAVETECRGCIRNSHQPGIYERHQTPTTNHDNAKDQRSSCCREERGRSSFTFQPPRPLFDPRPPNRTQNSATPGSETSDLAGTSLLLRRHPELA